MKSSLSSSTLLAILVATNSVCLAMPDNFSGTYVSITMGSRGYSVPVKMKMLQYREVGAPAAENSNFSPDKYRIIESPAAYQLVSGWGKMITDNIYFGGFINFSNSHFDQQQFRTGSLTYSYVDNTTSAFVINSFNYSNTFTVKQDSPNVGLMAKLGFRFLPKVLLWTAVGLENNSLKLTATSSLNGTSTENNTVSILTVPKTTYNKSVKQIGMAYAIGVNYAFSRTLSAYLSNTFVDYKDIDFDTTGSSTATKANSSNTTNIPYQVNVEHTLKMSIDNIMLGLVFRF